MHSRSFEGGLRLRSVGHDEATGRKFRSRFAGPLARGSSQGQRPARSSASCNRLFTQGAEGTGHPVDAEFGVYEGRRQIQVPPRGVRRHAALPRHGVAGSLGSGVRLGLRRPPPDASVHRSHRAGGLTPRPVAAVRSRPRTGESPTYSSTSALRSGSFASCFEARTASHSVPTRAGPLGPPHVSKV